MATVRLSVVIPVHDVARWLPACLRSVLAAAKGRSAEVICIDDGSTDDSAAILRRFPVRVLSQENRGYGAAINAGLDAVRGEFIAIVEPDDRVGPAAWDQALRLLEAEPAADFARAPYVEVTGWRRRVVGLADPPSGPFTAFDHPEVLALPPAIWSGVYRRASLEALGLRMPETPGAAFQDTYFAMRLLFSGARGIWADRPFYRYRADRPGASRDSRRRTDELLRIHDMVRRDLPAEARSRPEFPRLFHATCLRRLVWFMERVAPSYREEAFRQAYLQFLPTWRDAALTLAVAESLSPYQRSVFEGFAAGRFDAFHRQFKRPAARPSPAPAEADFDLAEAIGRDLTSLAPRPVAVPAAFVLHSAAHVVAAGWRAGSRVGLWSGA